MHAWYMLPFGSENKFLYSQPWWPWLSWPSVCQLILVQCLSGSVTYLCDIMPPVDPMPHSDFPSGMSDFPPVVGNASVLGNCQNLERVIPLKSISGTARVWLLFHMEIPPPLL